MTLRAVAAETKVFNINVSIDFDWFLTEHFWRVLCSIHFCWLRARILANICATRSHMDQVMIGFLRLVSGLGLIPTYMDS